MALTLSALAANGGTPSGKSVEELAAIFGQYPEGTGFNLSPEGDKFFAYMPREGDMGLMVFDVSDPKTGLSKGTFIKPNSTYEVSNAMWIDNDYIGYDLVAHDRYSAAFQIARAEPGKRSPKRYAYVNNDREFYRSLAYGFPTENRQFLVHEREIEWRHLNYEFFSPVIVEVNERFKAKDVKRWRNPDLFKRWIFKGTEPFAVTLKDPNEGTDLELEKTTYYTMNFDLVSGREKHSKETVMEWLEPLELPGYLASVEDDFMLLEMETEDGDRSGIGIYDYNKKELMGKPIFEDDYSLLFGETAGVVEFSDGGDVIGVYYETEKLKFVYFDQGIGSIMNQLENMMPDSVVYYKGLSADSRFLYYAVDSDTKSTSYYRLELATGNSELLYAARPWLADMQLPHMKPISFENREGQKIHGYMTLPVNFKEGSPVPMVVLSHGGPWVRDSWGYSDEVQFYASLGFAVLQVNYRGSKGFGIAYEFDEDMLDICDASPRDVIDGARWAIDQGFAKEGKIAFVGASYGAYLSLFCSAQAPDLPACAIGFAGVYDLDVMRKADEQNFMPWTQSLYGKFDENEDLVAKLSPSNHAEKIKAPILLVHGGNDSRVGYRQADAMYKALKKYDKDVEIVKRRFLLHGFANQQYKTEHFELVGNYLMKHLGP